MEDKTRKTKSALLEFEIWMVHSEMKRIESISTLINKRMYDKDISK